MKRYVLLALALLFAACSVINKPDDVLRPKPKPGSSSSSSSSGVAGDSGTPAECPNGQKETGEECDEGGNTESCDEDCTLPECGDSLLNPNAGEKCDDGGETPKCNADCTPAQCGDKTTNKSAGEECDEGKGVKEGESIETATCNTDCTAAKCGDGKLNKTAGEECDDGGLNPGDACSKECKPSPFVIDGPNVAPSIEGVAPVVAAATKDDAPHFLVTWRRDNGNVASLHFAYYTPQGKVAVNATKLSTTTAVQEHDVAVNGDGRALAVWRRADDQGVDSLRYRSIKKDGTADGIDDKFTQGAAPRSHVSVAASTDSEFCASWIQPIADIDTVHARCFDKDGVPKAGQPQAVGAADDSFYPAQRTQRIWKAKSGGYTVSWIDPQKGKLVGHVINKSGGLDGFPFDISGLSADTADPAGFSAGAGPFVSAFSVFDFHGKNVQKWRVLFQMFAAPGNPSGSNTLASPDHVDEQAPYIVGNATGSFLLVWDSTDQGKCTIRAHLYDSSAKPQGDVMNVSAPKANECDRLPRGAVDVDGNVMIVWAHTPGPNQPAAVQAVLYPGLLP
ncbi:MAG: hypothetical protein HY744_34500 [Deltaproteobacteria bacterium]|nr:hypothetical protein [Deltaproteobacteria bacterium]